MKEKKIHVKEEIHGVYLDIYTFEGEINNVIASLVAIRDGQNLKKEEQLEISITYGYDTYDVNLILVRPETDVEFKTRIDKKKKEEEKKIVNKEEQERKQKALYEVLKLKYEK